MGLDLLLLPGDGIGPEVIDQLRPLLESASDLTTAEADFGGIAIDKHGSPLPASTLERAQQSKAVLLGAVGAPRYDELPAQERPEQGLLGLRAGLEAYANLRPAMSFAELAGASSLKAEVVAGLDILLVRELTGGLYFGTPRGLEGEGDERAGFNTMKYTAREVRRVAKVAFESAQRRSKKLCSVDKANVLEVSMLWRETVTSMAADYPDVELRHLYVDNAAMQLVANPKQFDVMVTGNIFGDILSDLAAELAGSIGMLPSAAVGEGPGIFEPVHGSAPDIAGEDRANPCAAFLSLALACEHSLQRPQLAAAIRTAVQDVLADGMRTADIAAAGEAAVGCAEMGSAIVARCQKMLK